MNREQLDGLLTKHGIKQDGARRHGGKFCTLEIGTGCDYVALQALKNDLVANGACSVSLTRVSNDQHPQYGKPYIEIDSFWDE